MKNFLKIMALMLVCVMTLTVLASCGNDGETETQAQTENEEKAVVLKMGTNAAFPPYEYKEGEKFMGIDIEIAAAIAKELGATLEIVDMEFDSIITSVSKGEVDFGMAGMTVTDERKLEVDFSYSYATGVQSVIVLEGSDIKTPDDLTGKKIGVQLGTTGDIYASDDYGAENVTQYGKAQTQFSL